MMMELTLLILSIVTLLVIINLGILILSKISNQAPAQNNIYNEQIAITKGIQQSWQTINIALFKMYREMDILDFDSIQQKLTSTINQLATNPNEMNKWQKELNEYLQENK
jgi:hypothetical protein